MSEKPALGYLEIEICKKCNLNCKGCSHFAPLVKDGGEFDFEGYKHDIMRLSDIFSNINVIRLLGGEPLLNENILDILKFTRNIFKKSDIKIATNGVKLMGMSNEFFECLVKENVKLAISLYPILKDSKQKIIKFLESKGVEYKLSEKKKFAARLNLQGDFDGVKNANKCKIMCPTLKDGRIYRCSILASIDKFQDYFGKSTVECDDGAKVDIYRCDGAGIIKRLKEANKLCSYCSGNNDFLFDWALSEKKIEEWCIERKK